MAQNFNPTFVKTPNAQVTSITTGVGISGTNVIGYTGGVNGSKIVGCTLTASTTNAFDVRLSISGASGGTGYFNTVSVAASAGFASTVPPVSGMPSILPVDSDGNPFLFLPSTAWTLQFQVTSLSSQWTAGNFLALTVTAGDF